MMRGKALKFGDSISTDYIIPGKYFHLRSNLPELARHAMEGVDPQFASRVRSGDFLVAGKNFGLGSSREHAALVLKLSGIGAVLAESVARIFYRNAVNVGLPVLILDTRGIADGDELEVDLGGGKVRNLTRGLELSFNPLPSVMLRILECGGLVPYLKKYHRFEV